jgi:SOS-response transcriptional repressor LexA
MNYAHTEAISVIPIIRNPLDYRICAKDWPGGIGYYRGMASAAFDIDLVRTAMKQSGVTQTQLAQAIRLTSQSAMSDILKGKRQVKVQEAAAIYDYLRLSMVEGDTVVSIPIIGLAAAGRWREAIDMPIGRMAMPRSVAGPRAFAIEIAGDSINKLVPNGGWAVVDPDDKVLSSEKFYLLQNADFETTVKQYFKGPARFEPASTNPEHKGFEVGECDFVVLGRVVWKGEKL